MKYKLLRITLISVFAMLFSGGLFAAFKAASSEAVYTFTPVKNSSNSDYTKTYDVTINDILWSLPGNQSTEGQLRIGGKSVENTDRVMYTKTAISSAVGKLTFKHNGPSSDKLVLNSVTVTVASDADFANVIETVSKSDLTLAKNTEGFFDIEPTNDSWPANSYYKITYNITNPNNSNYAFQLTSIIFYGVADASDTRLATSMTLNFANGMIPTSGTAGQEIEAPSPTIVGANGNVLSYEEATVTWSSSDATVAEFVEGKMALKKVGKATMTATYAGNDTYKGCSASYELTVTAEAYTSFAALQADATATSTPVAIQFTGQKVVFASGSNAFIADNEGYGIMVYTQNHGLTAGDVLNGTIDCNLVLYQGAAEITNFDKTALTITSSDIIPVNTTIGAITTANQSTLVALKNVTYGSEKKVLSDGTNSITFYDKFKTNIALEDGKAYNVTGIVVLYNETIEICPRTADDIEESGGETDTRKATSMTLNFGNNAIPTSGTVGDVLEIPTAEVIITETNENLLEYSDFTIDWTSSDESVAYIAKGKAYLCKAGTATLTATFAGNDTYKGCSASYTMTVTETDPDPDEYNYAYEFKAKVFEAKKETKTLNEVDWSLEMTCDTEGYFGYDGTKGQQFGSGGNPVKAMKLFTSGIPGKIKKILVNTSGAKDIDATMTVTVGKDATKFTCNENESIKLTSTATDYEFTGEASGMIVLTFEQNSSKAIYIKTIKVLYEEGTTPEPEPDTYTVTFEKSGAEGEAPAAIEVNAGEKFKIPANRTMYKSGYTLTGWTDGENTYKAGDEVEPTANMTLSPVFTENMVTLADRTARVAIDFELDGYYDNPRYSFEGKSGIMVTQANVNGEQIDVKATVDAEKGKFVHNGSGWHQVNSGTKVIVPSCKGAEIIVETYNDAASVDFNGVAGTAYDNTVRYVAESDAETLTINQISNNYWQKLSIFMPKPEQGEEEKISGTFFSANVIATSAQNFAPGTTEISSDQATIVGGKMYAISEQEAEKALINKQGSTYYFSMTNNNTYFKVELDHALAVGDIITADANGGLKNDAEKGLWISTADARPNEAPACSATSATEGVITDLLKYTIAEGDEYVGAKTIYIYRAAGATEYFGNFEITRPGSVEPDPDPQPHDAVELVWDYTETAPSANPDNGLYYDQKVSDAAGTNNGMKGVKLNSSGYAYFAKPAVAGKLTLTFGNRKTADAYAVNVYACTIADGAATKGDLIGEVKVAESPGTGSIEIGADVTGIYIDRKTGSEGVLQKIVFKETVARTFVDFEITNDQLKGEFDASTLPAGVTFTGTQRNDTHGYGNVTLTVPVDGTVKFTIGGCQYASPATCKVTNAAGELLAEPNLKTATCYHQDGAAVTYIYVGEPTTLTFSDIAYLPYFKAEATEVSEATITYKDQNGNELGTKTVYEGDPIGEIPYTEADLTIPEGMKFRGWIYTNNIKVKSTDIVTGNVTVKASVTAIEEAPTVGSIQTYDLTQATFYPEDHENFSVENAAYFNNHGFTFAEGGSFTVAVTGKAQIVLTLCQYGNGTTIQVVDAEGKVVRDDVPAKAEVDGGTAIVNYEGAAGLLKFTFAAQTYLHKVTVYNVSDFIAKDEQSGYYLVSAGDAAGLVMALNAAAAEADSKIFLPNGTYDLGEATLTTISGKNVSIIGQSMEGVIIKNAPDVSMEGLGKADLFNNTAEGLYMQDLTLQNALDYYKAGTGRAPTLHDQGTKTINKNVRHLSYQDTYYSHKVGGLYYFEGGEIHGTVDYLCGNGKVYFNEVKLVNEQRSSATITANSELYVFNNCTVDNNATTYNLGRAWSDNPICVYLNTTLLDGGKSLASTRWNLTGINCDYSIAGEYNTMDAAGNNITPSENTVTFTKQKTTLNTILDATALETYSIQNVLGEWAATAQAETQQVEAPAARFENGNIVWEAVAGATAYAIFKDDALVAVTTETSILAENDTKSIYTIRSANARGGFGAAAEVTGKPTSINTVKAENGNDVIYNLQGVRVEKAQKGLYIVNGKKVVVK